jgi:hypothetical protein
LTVAAPIKGIIAIATSGILLAQANPALPTGSLDSVGRLTLDGALIVAVGVLWRALGDKDRRIEQKDQQVIEMATKVTETMTAVLAAVSELRWAVNDLRQEHGIPKVPATRGIQQQRT